MTNIITMETAARIWGAHREIETAKKLLADIEGCLRRGDDPTPIDPFGRRRAYDLGVPSGDNSRRLLDVSPRLAVHVIRAHIAEKEKDLAEACVMARMEIDGATPVEAS